MLKKHLLSALVLSFVFVSQSLAHPIVYSAAFAPEGGPGATGSGTATITVDPDLFTMRVEAVFSGLSGLVTASHVHCCTASPNAGNAGVATQLPSFVGFPTGVSSGSYDQTFDMTLAASWNPAFVTANGGTTGAAFSALLAGLDTNRSYLNIHTSTFSGGEIRARVSLVPEPATAATLALGLGLLARASRVRRA